LQYISDKNQNPFEQFTFKAIDHSRYDSILNQNGGTLSYKHKPHNYSHFNVQLQDWQLKLNSCKNVLEINTQDKNWARVISDINCNIHSAYSNVAITYIDTFEDKAKINQFLKISFLDPVSEQNKNKIIGDELEKEH
jgi:hypothetical protein